MFYRTFVREIHRCPMDSNQKGLVKRQTRLLYGVDMDQYIQ